ncbi:MAG TPA: ABC transporter permease, partial [Alcaligenes faecalis]|nr:ABC transporter permease [Alcaligenes faecalis]
MKNVCFLMARKLVFVLVTAFLLSMIVFFMLRVISADSLGMMLPPSATEADAQALRVELGMDGSALHQYQVWLSGVFRGNLGNSIFFHQPVTGLLA